MLRRQLSVCVSLCKLVAKSFILSHHGTVESCLLTRSTHQIKTDIFANSVVPAETARDEPSHHDLHYLPLTMNMS